MARTNKHQHKQSKDTAQRGIEGPGYKILSSEKAGRLGNVLKEHLNSPCTAGHTPFCYSLACKDVKIFEIIFVVKKWHFVALLFNLLTFYQAER